jgi:hypothetical protein
VILDYLDELRGLIMMMMMVIFPAFLVVYKSF